MTYADFTPQIKRLVDTYGKAAYPPERVSILWNAFSQVLSEVFSDAVTHLIASHRSAPMIQEFEKSVEDARSRVRQRHDTQFQGKGYLDILKGALNSANPEDKEFASQCVKLVEGLTLRRLTYVQFLQGCDLLDKVIKIRRGGFA